MTLRNSVLCVPVSMQRHRERRDPAHPTVGNRHLPGVRAWVCDTQIVGPFCIPQDTWFTAISKSLLCKFERKVKEVFFMLAVMLTMMTMIMGVPRPSTAVVLSTGFGMDCAPCKQSPETAGT